MEIILNIAWAVFSTGLVWFWVRDMRSHPERRGVQIVALVMVVLLLLPVISLSDDLMAMQGPAETTSSLRRAMHSDEMHPSVVPAALAMPEQIVASLLVSAWSQEALQNYGIPALALLLAPALDNRPPPCA
ncbi:hypothetical protein [Acidicapsa ligni]|uniref:hypothetical protein n=1 Tax=Acidicapsa ligni TaxID=542300 RepID=UPI0021E088E5|nr:hypothetical protein [Acidicapsa ligni]